MSRRWPTVKRHDDEPAPGLDLSRVIVLAYLIAVILGIATGIGWIGCQLVRNQFGG